MGNCGRFHLFVNTTPVPVKESAPLLLVLARASDRELARQVEYLKIENEILRRKLPRKIAVTPRERQRLLRFGKKLGSAINQLVSIVCPRTFARWLKADKTPSKRTRRKPGRPRLTASCASSSSAWPATPAGA